MPSSEYDLPALVALARETARGAGRLLLSMRDSTRHQPTTKSNPRDIVTRADHEAEAFIVSRLRATRGTDAIITEEGSTARTQADGIAWIVDPLDGTANYVSGAGPFSVSIGVTAAGRPVAGAVHLPAEDVTYWAVAGGGAYRDHTSLSTAAAPTLSEALVGVDGASDTDVRERQGRLIAELLPQVRDLRRIGCCSVAMAWVAEGRLDGFFCHGAGPWDVAAGAVIAASAGAWVGSEQGVAGPAPNILVAAPPLRDSLLDIAHRTG